MTTDCLRLSFRASSALSLSYMSITTLSTECPPHAEAILLSASMRAFTDSARSSKSRRSTLRPTRSFIIDSSSCAASSLRECSLNCAAFASRRTVPPPMVGLFFFLLAAAAASGSMLNDLCDSCRSSRRLGRTATCGVGKLPPGKAPCVDTGAPGGIGTPAGMNDVGGPGGPLGPWTLEPALEAVLDPGPSSHQDAADAFPSASGASTERRFSCFFA
mmetsp:Transcript_27799/g.64124  ORF Transcript_27799/g.64124 Transcript_27799/m.64124 type:complete len:217 (+) Transcript_27799:1220-1870(+)